MPAGSSWERGRRREREEGRGEKVGTETKFFPRETWWGGGKRRREKMTQRKRNKEKEAERQRERFETDRGLKFSDIHMWPSLAHLNS